MEASERVERLGLGLGATSVGGGFHRVERGGRRVAGTVREPQPACTRRSWSSCEAMGTLQFAWAEHDPPQRPTSHSRSR